MFEFTESIDIEVPPTEVWELIQDLEAWWLASNPEHEALDLLDEPPLREGTRLRIHERVAGIPGVAEGSITEFDPPSTVTFEAPAARYRWFGLPLTISEGVRWSVRPTDVGAELSATVWARFPDGTGGRAFEWVFRRLLRGVDKDRAHARAELDYLRGALEGRVPTDG